MIATLHNMAIIAYENEDYEKYFEYESQAYQMAFEINDAMGLFHVGQSYGQILYAMGRKEEGIQIIKISYAIGQQAGFPNLEQLAALIDQLEESK